MTSSPPGFSEPSGCTVIRAQRVARLESQNSVASEAMSGVLRDESDPAAWSQLDLFAKSAQRWIFKRLNAVSFEPRVPHGRDREADTASRLMRIASLVRAESANGSANGGDARLPGVFSRRLIALSNSYGSVKGCYYTMKALRPSGAKKDLHADTADNWRFHRDRAVERDDQDVAWACNIAMEGKPDAISDFIVEPMYVLSRNDGRQFRMVRLRNVHGERTPPVSVGAKAWSNTDGLREFCNNQKGGGFTWMAGHTELHELNADVAAKLQYRFVRETARWGWQDMEEDTDGDTPHGESLFGLWVFGDGIIVSENGTGRFLLPGSGSGGERDGVYWVGPANGWVIGREDMTGAKQTEERGEPWGQDVPTIGAPVFDRRTRHWLTPYLERVGESHWKSVLKRESVSAQAAHMVEVNALIGEYVKRMEETLGSMDAHMAIGLMASFAALPETFRRWSQQAGLWLHGEKGQGKNSVMRWLAKMWGLPGSGRDGVPFNSTEASMHVLTSQYSCLPAWLDEYTGTRAGGEWKDELLKGNLNRSARSKMTLGSGRREWKAALVVTGQHTSANAAVVSRYVHAQVSGSRRRVGADGERVNHVEWFQRHRELFVMFGRELLLKRGIVVKRLLRELDEWMETPEMVRSDHRSAFVHGLAYAGLRAAGDVFDLPMEEECWNNFRRHVASRCTDAVGDVATRVDADLVLTDLVSAIQVGVFGETAEEQRRFFNAHRLGVDHPPGFPDQTAANGFGQWSSWRLYLMPNAVFGALSEHVRRQNRELALRISDFKAQISQRAAWVPGQHIKRFGPTTSRCWAFDLDRMPTLGATMLDTESLRGELLLSLAESAGIQPGEAIEQANGQPIETAALDPALPIQFTFSRSDGSTRHSEVIDGGLSRERGWDWPDPRKGPLTALAERVAYKKTE